MSVKTGGCLCGAVRFSAQDVPDVFGACHCEMCRRWTGSALLGVTVATKGVSWEGAEHIARAQTSGWAERAWCAKCGSGLYYHVTLEGDYAAFFEMPIGLFDDADGFVMTSEIYIDRKPDSFAYAGEGRELSTQAECEAKYAGLSGG